MITEARGAFDSVIRVGLVRAWPPFGNACTRGEMNFSCLPS